MINSLRTLECEIALRGVILTSIQFKHELPRQQKMETIPILPRSGYLRLISSQRNEPTYIDSCISKESALTLEGCFAIPCCSEPF